MHSGRLKLANAWIPFNKPQKGGRGPSGPTSKSALGLEMLSGTAMKSNLRLGLEQVFHTHIYTYTPTPNTVSEQLAREGFGELNTSPFN